MILTGNVSSDAGQLSRAWARDRLAALASLPCLFGEDVQELDRVGRVLGVAITISRLDLSTGDRVLYQVGATKTAP